MSLFGLGWLRHLSLSGNAPCHQSAGSTVPFCMCGVDALRFLHASAARLPVCSRHALDKTLLGKAAATLHQAVFKSGFSLQFQEVMAAPSTEPRTKPSDLEQLRSRTILSKRLSKAKETLKIADGTTMDLRSHHSRQPRFDSLRV